MHILLSSTHVGTAKSAVMFSRAVVLSPRSNAASYFFLSDSSAFMSIATDMTVNNNYDGVI